ncbi:MAG: pseudouridine synthase [Microcystaceae cyanobacterium]
MAQRVQKLLSQWGIASRRSAEQMIVQQRVKVNGQIVQLGDRADPYCDRIEVDGKPLNAIKRPQLRYILLNKPIGVISTCDDPQGRRTVLDLLPPSLKSGQGLHPVGRLDINSSGLLLLTNDGDLTLKLTHPRYHLPKTYQVILKGQLSPQHLQQWRKGVLLDGELTLPAQVKVLKGNQGETKVEIIISEGKNRQIRRIAEKFGLKVLKLHRTHLGRLSLQSPKGNYLERGQYRLLSSSEIRSLKQGTISSKLKMVVSE